MFTTKNSIQNKILKNQIPAYIVDSLKEIGLTIIPKEYLKEQNVKPYPPPLRCVSGGSNTIDYSYIGAKPVK